MFKELIWNIFYKKDMDFVFSKLDVDESLTKCLTDKQTFESQIEQLNFDIEGFVNLIKDQDELIKSIKKEEELEKLWNNKYPKSNIVYSGRNLPFSTIKCNIPINILITPNDGFIIQDVKNNELMGNTNTDWEIHLPKIYKYIRNKYYKYKMDKAVWGNPEVWEFPFELREKGFSEGFDCDSWSHFQASYYIAAGFPRWRMRVVCGDTQLGGHSTIYIFSLKDNKWHHLNSTYGHSYDNVIQYPTHYDADYTDKIGIKRVWFSFNDKYCWRKFEDKLPEGLSEGTSEDEKI